MVKYKKIVTQGVAVDMVSHDGGNTWWAASLPSNGIPAGIHKMEGLGRHGVQHFERRISGRKGRKKIITPAEEMPLRKVYKKKEAARAAVDAARPEPHQIGYAKPNVAYTLLQELGVIKKNAIQQALEKD